MERSRLCLKKPLLLTAGLRQDVNCSLLHESKTLPSSKIQPIRTSFQGYWAVKFSKKMRNQKDFLNLLQNDDYIPVILCQIMSGWKVNAARTVLTSNIFCVIEYEVVRVDGWPCKSPNFTWPSAPVSAFPSTCFYVQKTEWKPWKFEKIKNTTKWNGNRPKTATEETKNSGRRKHHFLVERWRAFKLSQINTWNKQQCHISTMFFTSFYVVWSLAWVLLITLSLSSWCVPLED